MSKLCELCLLLDLLLWRLAGTLVPTNHLHEKGWRVSLWPLKNKWSQTVICSWTKGPLLTFQPSFNAIKLSKHITLMHPTDWLSSIYCNHPYPTSKTIIFITNIQLTSIFYGFEGVCFSSSHPMLENERVRLKTDTAARQQGAVKSLAWLLESSHSRSKQISCAIQSTSKYIVFICSFSCDRKRWCPEANIWQETETGTMPLRWHTLVFPWWHPLSRTSISWFTTGQNFTIGGLSFNFVRRT